MTELQTELIHKLTLEYLAENREKILKQYYRECGDDPSYFALFLKKNKSVFKLSEVLIELSSYEWTLYNVVQSKGAYIRGAESGLLRLNPTLSLVRNEFDLDLFLENKNEVNKRNVIAIYLDQDFESIRTCKILPEWAFVLDVLSDGPCDFNEMHTAIRNRTKVHFKDDVLRDMISHLTVLGLIEK